MTATLILAGISALCWLLYFYPYLLYPLALRLLSKQPIHPAPLDSSASLLFCAYNEIDCLPRKIDNLRELKRHSPSLQILVYDDGSTDGTHELLKSVPDLLTVVCGPGRTGKAAGMKQLVQHAQGEILVFTDADVALAPDAIERLLPYYADAEIGGVCCTVRMLSDSGNSTSETGSLYWSWDDRLQQLESATGNVMGASGALFSVRRALYPEFPNTVQDDFTASMSVIFQSRRLIKALDVIASTNGVSRRDEELRRKIRIGTRAYHTHSFLRPHLKRMSRRDRFKYVSRKMLRWFGGLFVALGTISAVATVATLSVPLAALLLLLLLVLAIGSVVAQSGLLGRLGQISVATFATFFGVVQGMRGRTATTWAPAKSR
ncbi:MAG: glycosyltransferase [Pseudomonadota bacterium]|nr:glycosyltransferase [Pseudomonadota bacterium]